MIWNPQADAALLSVIGNCSTLKEVSSVLERKYGYSVSDDAIQKRLKRLGQKASELLSRSSSKKYNDEYSNEERYCLDGDSSKDISRLINLTAKRAVSFEDIEKKTGLDEDLVRDLVDEASELGYDIRIIDDGWVTSRSPRLGNIEGYIPKLGSMKPGRYRVAIATDIHFGSSYCDTKALKQFFEWAHSKGATIGVCTGDILDGNKDVLLYEQERVGFDRQVQQAVETWRNCPIRTWVVIDGNHDGYYSSSMGTISGRLLANEMKAAGLDWHFLGVCLGRAIIHGAKWHLWHPHGGSGTRHGVRKVLNDRIEDLEEHTDIVAIGHFHKYSTINVYPEHVFGIAGGTFQRKETEFANRIARSWDVGGAIVSYNVDDNGRISEVAAEFWEAP